LAVEAPEEYEAVKRGERSINAASIRAGIRKRRIPVRLDDADSAARTLRTHMPRDQRIRLAKSLVRTGNAPRVMASLRSVAVSLLRLGGHDNIAAANRHHALAAAGVIPAFKGRNYPPAREHGMHAVRHWYSTTLQDSGVSLAGVMEFLGHSRTSMPLAVGVYGHVTEATFEAARNAVDSTLFALRPVESHGTVTELRRGQSG
jgi:hypothetical protein